MVEKVGGGQNSVSLCRSLPHESDQWWIAVRCKTVLFLPCPGNRKQKEGKEKDRDKKRDAITKLRGRVVEAHNPKTKQKGRTKKKKHQKERNGMRRRGFAESGPKTKQRQKSKQNKKELNTLSTRRIHVWARPLPLPPP